MTPFFNAMSLTINGNYAMPFNCHWQSMRVAPSSASPDPHIWWSIIKLARDDAWSWHWQSVMIGRYACVWCERTEIREVQLQTGRGREPAEIKTQTKVAGKNLTLERHKEVSGRLRKWSCHISNHHSVKAMTRQHSRQHNISPFLPSFLPVFLISRLDAHSGARHWKSGLWCLH